MKKKIKIRKPGSNRWLMPEACRAIPSEAVDSEEDLAALEVLAEILKDIRTGVPGLLRELERQTSPEDFDGDGMLREDAEVTAGAFAAIYCLRRMELVACWIDDICRTECYEAAAAVLMTYSATMEHMSRFVEVQGLENRLMAPAYGEEEGEGHEEH